MVGFYEEGITFIQRNSSWELVDLPKGKKTIGLKWNYKTKYHANGSVQRHKARLVAKGFSQVQDIDFEDSYSPAARLETIRVFLSLAAQMKWQVYHLDVKFAFLNGEIQEEVYVL